MLETVQIPVLDDNYIYLVHDTDTQATAVVDPAVAAPVLEEAEKRGWEITHIFNTHHHHDHVGGNEEIQKATGAIIVGAACDMKRIPGIQDKVSEGDIYNFGAIPVRVFEVPGHTSGHIAFWFETGNALFCGDALFALGCGRLFEGSAKEMWESLSKFKDLPDEAQVYCAHEYTLSNANFAITIDPNNLKLQKRVKEIKEMREKGIPTVPSSLGTERETNPFLRADNDEIAANLNMRGEDNPTVFAEIRLRKDNF